MRLMFLASAVILATAAGAAAPSQQQVGDMPVVNPNAGNRAGCPPTSRYEAARRGGPLGPQRLNELPAADMYKAVYRRIDGCEVPIIAGYDIGGRTSGRR